MDCLVGSSEPTSGGVMPSERNKTVPVVLAVLAVAAIGLLVFAIYVVMQS